MAAGRLAHRLVHALAALMGGAGVALAAAAAHVTGGGNLETAAYFLLFHAAAVIALAAAPGRAALIAAAQWMLLAGALVFSGTLALGALLDIHLAPSPAPWGGTLMILGWLVAAAGLFAPGEPSARSR
ncbi:DUF423 domain-containing protein [Propylenella binzhouense]|uniref:DUF423 domain-containing protein n=1 Tax=Propylenella binzhouense TaxID=2555902 RepID=A0A964T0W8_9HYPH|nr:DUF423 domain-containing protein [Propylenella binzhouense]MYZ46376.1 DUF423 domain-containing protein [Propylenella binzhouense]